MSGMQGVVKKEFLERKQKDSVQENAPLNIDQRWFTAKIIIAGKVDK